MTEKQCSGCGVVKGVVEFHKAKATKDGLHRWCKQCVKIYIKRRDFPVSVTEKQCSGCKETKKAGEFYIDKHSTDGLKSACKTCLKARARATAQTVLVRERFATLSALKNRPCEDCGGTFPTCAMDWHHRDPKTKTMIISNNKKLTPEVWAEIQKCDLLCSNCHRIRHFNEGTKCD